MRVCVREREREREEQVCVQFKKNEERLGGKKRVGEFPASPLDVVACLSSHRNVKDNRLIIPNFGHQL